jgi:hypothetical protein
VESVTATREETFWNTSRTNFIGFCPNCCVCILYDSSFFQALSETPFFARDFFKVKHTEKWNCLFIQYDNVWIYLYPRWKVFDYLTLWRCILIALLIKQLLCNETAMYIRRFCTTKQPNEEKRTEKWELHYSLFYIRKTNTSIKGVTGSTWNLLPFFIIRRSSPSSVSEEHFIEPSMFIYLSVYRDFTKRQATCMTGVWCYALLLIILLLLFLGFAFPSWTSLCFHHLMLNNPGLKSTGTARGLLHPRG